MRSVAVSGKSIPAGMRNEITELLQHVCMQILNVKLMIAHYRLTHSCSTQGQQRYNEISGQNTTQQGHRNSHVTNILTHRIGWIESKCSLCMGMGDMDSYFM